jgi:hypothetical protein
MKANPRKNWKNIKLMDHLTGMWVLFPTNPDGVLTFKFPQQRRRDNLTMGIPPLDQPIINTSRVARWCPLPDDSHRPPFVPIESTDFIHEPTQGDDSSKDMDRSHAEGDTDGTEYWPNDIGHWSDGV